MNFFEQLNQRRVQLHRKQHEVAQLTGIAAPHVSTILKGQKDVQASTLAALADAVDAQWVLVPKHMLAEVERLLSGKAVGPDDVDSTVDQLFGRKRDE
jgi:transcriptional regulator with XRE-family HTH domain